MAVCVYVCEDPGKGMLELPNPQAYTAPRRLVQESNLRSPVLQMLPVCFWDLVF